MNILGIESSCDETSASIVVDGSKVLSHVLATSADMHAKTGGIIPEMAAREQVKSIIPVVSQVLENSGLTIRELDCIAVTFGPGLLGSLLVGVETAKTLSCVWDKPLVPTNHLVGHVYANWLESSPPTFPAIALVVSGGHTDLVLMQDHGKIKWLGGTRDDAAGEAFDKTARLLGLPYPGGPAIAAAADHYFRAEGSSSAYPGGPVIGAEAAKFTEENPDAKLQLFPRPLLDENNFDWSFSGLKSAVAREVQKTEVKNEEKPKLAAEIQEAIVDILVLKTMRAVKKFKPKTLLLGGGVAANARLREKMELAIGHLALGTKLSIAPPKFCTDNASMIAAAAYYNYSEVEWRELTAVPELTITGER